MTGKNEDLLRNILTPEIMRTRLIACSIYLTAFHLLKASIIERIESFFHDRLTDDGWIIDPAYQTDVLSRKKSRVHASLDWLKDNGAITEGDLAIYARLNERRNKISHALHQIILNGDFTTDLPSLFIDLQSLLKKIEVWWIVNFDLQVTMENPPKNIQEADIVPGPLLAIQMMIDVALGTEEEAGAYLAAYLKAKGESPQIGDSFQK